MFLAKLKRIFMCFSEVPYILPSNNLRRLNSLITINVNLKFCHFARFSCVSKTFSFILKRNCLNSCCQNPLKCVVHSQLWSWTSYGDVEEISSSTHRTVNVYQRCWSWIFFIPRSKILQWAFKRQPCDYSLHKLVNNFLHNNFNSRSASVKNSFAESVDCVRCSRAFKIFYDCLWLVDEYGRQ